MQRQKSTAGDELSHWPGLPPEILWLIGERLDSRLDVLRFRAVCRSWRSSFPLSAYSSSNSLLCPILPQKISNPPSWCTSVPSADSSKAFVLSATTTYLFQPINSDRAHSSSSMWETTPSWLLTVDELNPGKLWLRKPLSKTPLAPLPHDLPMVINLLDFRIIEVGKEYNLSYCCLSGKRFEMFKVPYMWSGYFEKVVLVKNPKLDDDFSAMVLVDEGKLGLLRLASMEWRYVHDGRRFKFDDIVNYKGEFCGINRRGKAYVIDYDTLEMTTIASPIFRGGGRRKRLVESCGDLYLLVRCSVLERTTTARFKVYRLNEKKQKWVEVSSLGGRVFFVGMDLAFSLPPGHIRGCQGNCIFFVCHSFPTYNDHDFDDNLLSGYLDIGVFNLENNGSFRKIDSHPGYSDIIWPPPPWFKQDPSLATLSMSNSVEAVETCLSKIVAFTKEQASCKMQRRFWLGEIEKGNDVAKLRFEEAEKMSKKIEKDTNALLTGLAASFDEVSRWFNRSDSLDEIKYTSLAALFEEAYTRVSEAMRKAEKSSRGTW